MSEVGVVSSEHKAMLRGRGHGTVSAAWLGQSVIACVARDLTDDDVAP